MSYYDVCSFRGRLIASCRQDIKIKLLTSFSLSPLSENAFVYGLLVVGVQKYVITTNCCKKTFFFFPVFVRFFKKSSASQLRLKLFKYTSMCNEKICENKENCGFRDFFCLSCHNDATTQIATNTVAIKATRISAHAK